MRPSVHAPGPVEPPFGSEGSGEASDEGGTPSFGGSCGEGEPPAAAARGPEPIGEQAQERDNLLHWWCLKQLPRYLQRLSKCPEAGPFREPLPWKELGLLDYLEVVQRPMDLKTINDTLESGGYEDTEGLVNPEFFWEDVALCWDNCTSYYDGDDEEVEACRMAEEMRTLAADLEDEFWSELEHFEGSLEHLDPTLRSVAAITDVAARTVEDAAAAAYEDGSAVAKEVMDRIAKWWWGDRKKAKTPERPPPLNITLRARKPLKEHYQEIMMMQLKYDALEDVNYIEGVVLDAFDVSWPSFKRDSRVEDEDDEEGLRFEGADRKLPIARLVPAQDLAEKRWNMVRSRMNPSRPHSVSSRRSSPGSSRDSRGASPALSEISGGNGAAVWRPPTPPLAGRSRKSAASSHNSEASRPSSLRGRPLHAPVASSAAAVVSLLPESNSESDKNTAAPAPDVQSLRRMMPKRAARTPPPE